MPDETMAPGWPISPYVLGGQLHFLHLGKCAGTTVRLIVQNCFAAPEILQFIVGLHGYIKREDFEAATREHPSARFSAAHFGSTIFNIAPGPLNVFTWLRDPLDAAFSIIYFVQQQHAHTDREEHRKKWEPYAGAVKSAKSPFEALNSVIELCRRTGTADFNPLRPLSFLLADPPANPGLNDPISSAITTLERCFFVGLLEEQQTSLEMLSRFLPLRCPAGAFQTNQCLNRPSASRQLTGEERRELLELLAPDYEVYAAGKRIWELQRDALKAEGWFDQPLEQRQTQAFHQLYPESTDSGRWTAEDRAFAEGFHDIEFDEAEGEAGNFFWRWMLASHRTAIRLPITPGLGVCLSIEFAEITPTESLKTLRLLVGGIERGLRYRGRHGRCHRFDVIVERWPDGHVGMDLELTGSKCFKPPLPDTRTLGVALHAISWEPLVGKISAGGSQHYSNALECSKAPRVSSTHSNE